jgi:hypothetical protein
MLKSLEPNLPMRLSIWCIGLLGFVRSKTKFLAMPVGAALRRWFSFGGGL